VFELLKIGKIIFPKNVGVIRASQFIEHIQYTFRWIWLWRGWL